MATSSIHSSFSSSAFQELTSSSESEWDSSFSSTSSDFDSPSRSPSPGAVGLDPVRLSQIRNHSTELIPISIENLVYLPLIIPEFKADLKRFLPFKTPFNTLSSVAWHLLNDIPFDKSLKSIQMHFQGVVSSIMQQRIIDLNEEDRNLVYREVSLLSGSPIFNREYGRLYCFQKTAVLFAAVHNAILNKYDLLHTTKKIEVHRKIVAIVNAKSFFPHDITWAKIHAKRNLLRLAYAMDFAKVSIYREFSVISVASSSLPVVETVVIPTRD